MAGMLVDGYDTEQLGLVVRSAPGWRDRPRQERPTARIPGRAREQALSTEYELLPRAITVTGVQSAADLATLTGNLDELKRRLSRDVVQVVLPDEPGRHFLAECTLIEPSSVPPAFTQTAHELRIELMCYDPAAYDESQTIVDFTASAQELQLGTAVVFPVIIIDGAVTNPALSYKDSAGVEVLAMQFTATLGAGDQLVIDSNAMTIRDGAGGNQAAALTSGDFILLRPEDAAGLSGPWPTIGITPQPGQATITYRRAWL